MNIKNQPPKTGQADTGSAPHHADSAVNIAISKKDEIREFEGPQRWAVLIAISSITSCLLHYWFLLFLPGYEWYLEQRITLKLYFIFSVGCAWLPLVAGSRRGSAIKVLQRIWVVASIGWIAGLIVAKFNPVAMPRKIIALMLPAYLTCCLGLFGLIRHRAWYLAAGSYEARTRYWSYTILTLICLIPFGVGTGSAFYGHQAALKQAASYDAEVNSCMNPCGCADGKSTPALAQKLKEPDSDILLSISPQLSESLNRLNKLQEREKKLVDELSEVERALNGLGQRLKELRQRMEKLPQRLKKEKAYPNLKLPEIPPRIRLVGRCSKTGRFPNAVDLQLTKVFKAADNLEEKLSGNHDYPGQISYAQWCKNWPSPPQTCGKIRQALAVDPNAVLDSDLPFVFDLTIAANNVEQTLKSRGVEVNQIRQTDVRAGGSDKQRIFHDYAATRTIDADIVLYKIFISTDDRGWLSIKIDFPDIIPEGRISILEKYQKKYKSPDLSPEAQPSCAFWTAEEGGEGFVALPEIGNHENLELIYISLSGAESWKKAGFNWQHVIPEPCRKIVDDVIRKKSKHRRVERNSK